MMSSVFMGLKSNIKLGAVFYEVAPISGERSARYDGNTINVPRNLSLGRIGNVLKLELLEIGQINVPPS